MLGWPVEHITEPDLGRIGGRLSCFKIFTGASFILNCTNNCP